jgi:dolichol-phosphate mannosyltransferase
MDADLQHPPELIPVFIEKWKEGYHIVYTQREKSPSNSYFKNFSSSFFYKLMNWLSDVEFEEGTADFRLLDKQVVSLIRQSSETNLFLRGYINWLGFKRFKIVYKPNERFAGTTKYSLKKMVNLAISGITAFSIKPLQMAVYLGLTISLFAFLYALYAFYMYFFGQKVISGWTSVILSILFVGGAQLTILGIIGQYLGYALMQVKKRPDYIIQEKTID